MAIRHTPLLDLPFIEEVNDRVRGRTVDPRSREWLASEASVGRRQVDAWFTTRGLQRPLISTQRPPRGVRDEPQAAVRAPHLVRVRYGVARVGAVTQTPSPGFTERNFDEFFPNLRHALDRIEKYRNWDVDPYISEYWYRIQLYSNDSKRRPWKITVFFYHEYDEDEPPIPADEEIVRLRYNDRPDEPWIVTEVVR